MGRMMLKKRKAQCMMIAIPKSNTRQVLLKGIEQGYEEESSSARHCRPSLKNTTWVDRFGSKVSTQSGPNGFPYISSISFGMFVEQYEVALRFKYKKELKSQASERKQFVRPTIAFDWDMQIYDHYTRTIYDFFRVHVVRLPHCEIERHVDFDAIEGVEVYNVTDYSIRIDYHGDNFVFTVEYRPSNQYIECNCKTFENEGIACCYIMRTMTFNRVHLFHDRYILRHWRRDIVRPHMSKFFLRGYLTMMDEYRVYNGIKKWLDRNCDLVLDYPVRHRDLKNVLKACFKTYIAWKYDMVVPNIPDSDSTIDSTVVRNSREPTEESSDGIQHDTEQLFNAMVELDEKIRRSQDRLEFMMIRVNTMEERIEVIRKEIFDRYRKDQDNFLRPST
ncbi:hypothetical protein T459_01263 [Capsicum annuum]|uniref:Protein FAR1-RELATED SEQUENCE n=1 Tax=Capsicum annuum TaxID=4072 RepID=A0A2G3AGL0_CAPAN|nr:hypothetical protein T459_01263 [Capsicum annuum]